MSRIHLPPSPILHSRSQPSRSNEIDVTIGYSLADCPIAPEGDSWPCLEAGAFLVRVCKSKSAGKTKYTVSSYFNISLDVRKQSSVLFPAPQSGEVRETGGGCGERQKESTSKWSRKIIIIVKKKISASFCSVKQYILEKNTAPPRVFSPGIYNSLRN